MSKVADLPFRPNQESGWDALGGGTTSAVNVIIDGKGTVRRRPGISTYDQVLSTAIDSDPVIGLHATSRSNTEIYAVTGTTPGSVNIYRALTASAHLLKAETMSYRPTFAETGAMLAFADGRRISRIDLDTHRVSDISTDAPQATHVVAQASRLLANDVRVNTSAVHYSDVATGAATEGHEIWGGNGTSGQFTAEARPDPVVALGENSNEVFVFGKTTTQAFVSDVNFVYTPISTREFGCSAPYSVIRDDQSFAWLDHRRRFVHSDGRSVSILSQPIQATLDAMTKVDDCFGMRIHHGPTDVLLWKFPEDGRTFAYQKGGGWSLWMNWDENQNVWKNWAGNAHAHVPGSNVNVVGTEASKLGRIDSAAYTDLGGRIPAHVQTGAIWHGVDLLKRNVALRLTLRRGETTATDEPLITLQWRDDGGEWQAPVEVSLGSSGDREPVVPLRSLGVYRSREWRFSFHRTSEDLVLAKATEEFEILDR